MTYNLMGEEGAIRNKCLRKPLGGATMRKRLRNTV